MEHAKSNVWGTHKHNYVVFNAYHYMLKVANLGSKTALYKGVLLSAVVQDAENHIFLVTFGNVDKEYDASYKYIFFPNMRSFVDDTDKF